MLLLLSLQYYECYIIDTYRVRGRVPVFTPQYTYDTRIVTVVNYSSLAGRRRRGSCQTIVVVVGRER